nr:hypothetical protein [Tanacetum cinerariifolium]
MTNRIDIVLKAITDRIARALPSDTVKNLKLNLTSTTFVLSSRSYPTKDLQCLTHTHSSINTITLHPKQQSNSRDSKAEEEEQKRKGNPEDTDNITHNKKQKDTPQLELNDTTAVDNLGSNRDDEGIEWLDFGEPPYFVDTSKESVYESLIQKMPKCLLNYDFRIQKGDPRNLKIPCMIDDYDRGCRKPSNLEDGFYKDTIKLGPEYLTVMGDEGEVT